MLGGMSRYAKVCKYFVRRNVGCPRKSFVLEGLPTGT